MFNLTSVVFLLFQECPPMLNDRAQRLLKTLVERYIADGQPVGSRTLSMHSGLDLSSASIRNVLADLENMGLVISPHPRPAGCRRRAGIGCLWIIC